MSVTVTVPTHFASGKNMHYCVRQIKQQNIFTRLVACQEFHKKRFELSKTVFAVM